MKSNILPMMAVLLGPVIFPIPQAIAQAGGEDMVKIYESGRRAFHKGDLPAAEVAFARVLRANPDFDLAQIYMAQIRHAEAQWEARPRSQKIAEQSRVGVVDLHRVALSEALEVVRREVEKAGGGAKAGAVVLLSDLPETVAAQPVTLSVRNLPMQDFVDMVAFSGNVRIAWHPQGLSVTANPARPAAEDPATAMAVKRMRDTARAQVISSIRLTDATVEQAVAWLQAQADPKAGPRLVLRDVANNVRVNLNLRNSSIPDALRSLAIVADLEVTWHPWGAGLAPKTAWAASQNAAPANEN